MPISTPREPARPVRRAPGPSTRTQGATANYNEPAPPGFIEPPDHALGRSRGGLSTKVHLCCDGRGLPLSFTLTAGQAGDNPQVIPVLDAISVRTGRSGRPRHRPERLLADKAYSHPSTRAALRARGIRATIPERSDQLARRRARGPGRPYAFDAELYKNRNVVERCFNRLKQWRAIATRYDKTARNYRGGVLLASLVLWTRA